MMSNAKEIPKMSSEEIADEIRKEALEKHMPYYAAMIERYADVIAKAHTTQRLTALKKKLENMYEDAKESFGQTDSDLDFTKGYHNGETNAFATVLTLIEEELQ